MEDLFGEPISEDDKNVSAGFSSFEAEGNPENDWGNSFSRATNQRIKAKLKNERFL